MKELWFQSLMKLFALISGLNNDEGYVDRLETVRVFLLHYLSDNKANEYIRIYEFHYNFFKIEPEELSLKKKSVRAVKILALADELSWQLNINIRIHITLTLIELSKNENSFNSLIVKYIQVFTASVGLSANEYKALSRFVGTNPEYLIGTEGYLLADAQSFFKNRHIQIPYLKGQLIFYKSKALDVIFVRSLHDSEIIYLNGRQIICGQVYQISWGESITGPYINELTYSKINKSFFPESKRHFSFTINEATFFDKKGNGFHPFSACFYSGQIVGLIGEPNVGKSLIINTLMGGHTLSSGSILLNNSNIESLNNQRVTCSWMGVLHTKFEMPNISIAEYLALHAKLCGAAPSVVKAYPLIFRLLNYISEKAKVTVAPHQTLSTVKSITQKICIALVRELLHHPKVIFADKIFEKVTMSEERDIIFLLKELSAQGYLIILSCMRPDMSVFKTLDQIVVIDEGGYPIYCGEPEQSYRHFAAYNTKRLNVNNLALNLNTFSPDNITEFINMPELDDKGISTGKRKIKPKEWYKYYTDNFDIEIHTNSLPLKLKSLSFHWFSNSITCYFFNLKNRKNKKENLHQFFGMPLLVLIGLLIIHILEYQIEECTYKTLSLFALSLFAFHGFMREISKVKQFLDTHMYFKIKRLSIFNGIFISWIVTFLLQFAFISFLIETFFNHFFGIGYIYLTFIILTLSTIHIIDKLIYPKPKKLGVK
jgi:ABC-type multidrug transport system ATPase subunit